MSIQTKLYLTLAAILPLFVAVSVTVSLSSEKSLYDDTARNLMVEKASSYLDSMNMLMVSGAMQNRELLREKLMADDNILDARMLRADKITQIYGPGAEHENPSDELDRRALAGETVWQEKDTPQGRTLTYITPVLAESNYRGTNCLGCHMAKENEVLGATRITLSLQKTDEAIQNNALRLASTQIGMMAIAAVLLSLLLKKVIVSPIQKMQKTLSYMEKNSDLTHKVSVHSQDEIGQASKTLNAMITRFADSLNQVVHSTARLKQSASEIEGSADKSLVQASRQREQAEHMRSSMEELIASTREVSSSADQSANASREAQSVAEEGINKTRQASDHINTMNLAVQETASVIKNLDEKSNNVGNVLEVIKGIAEQTNLLALNAAIEAARAGESGRGFAVVADEVRTLSQRTHESAQEIEAMIAQLQQEAKNAVGSMNNAQEVAQLGVAQVEDATDVLQRM
ncbi:MAG: methyl-accepting chemotaxis protein, partial [Oceanobacter sp.]